MLWGCMRAERGDGMTGERGLHNREWYDMVSYEATSIEYLTSLPKVGIMYAPMI